MNKVLRIQTRGGSMVGADDSTELWQHPTSHWFWITPVEAKYYQNLLETFQYF